MVGGAGGGGGLLIWAAAIQRAEKDIRLIMSQQGESCQHRVANRVAPLIPEALKLLLMMQTSSCSGTALFGF